MSDTNSLKIAVIIASKGRPFELGELAKHLTNQTRRADRVIFSVTDDGDLPDFPVADYGVEVVFGPAGLPAQRNTGMARDAKASDLYVFFDDDYYPETRALSQIEAYFLNNPDVDGMNGTLIDDGINGPGLDALESIERLRAFDETADGVDRNTSKSMMALYGCNMVFRTSAIADERFDEELPMYGWQEDIDFCGSLAKNGAHFTKSNSFYGIHCGVKRARSPGKKLGYSQLANPVYMVRKGTMTGKFARRLVLRNILANHAKAFFPEPWVDRKGRVIGNWIAIKDWLSGKMHPKRILELK